jgi:hypothetical protein
MSIRTLGPDAEIDPARRERYDAESRNLHPLLPIVTSSSMFTTPHPSFVPQSMALPTTSYARPSHFSFNPIPDIHIVSPPLPRRQCIPLPQLSYAEMQINPLLVNGIDYNIRAPTSFAACPSRRHSSRGRDAWRYELAVHPTVPSLTIYLDFDSDRPIVVFPTHNNHDASITIAHVLAAVNHRVTAVGDELQQAYNAGYPVQLLPREVYWAGLVPSSTERDVWVLRTD